MEVRFDFTHVHSVYFLDHFLKVFHLIYITWIKFDRFNDRLMSLIMVRKICKTRENRATRLAFFYLYRSGLMTDLLWSDPDNDLKRWDENDAGVSRRFGVDIINEVRHQANFCCPFFELIFISVLDSTQHGFDCSIASSKLFHTLRSELINFSFVGRQRRLRILC